MTGFHERRILDSGYGAAWLGRCERCGRHCPAHFFQQWRSEPDAAWNTAGVGHLQCVNEGIWASVPVVKK